MIKTGSSEIEIATETMIDIEYKIGIKNLIETESGTEIKTNTFLVYYNNSLHIINAFPSCQLSLYYYSLS